MNKNKTKKSLVDNWLLLLFTVLITIVVDKTYDIGLYDLMLEVFVLLGLIMVNMYLLKAVVR